MTTIGNERLKTLAAFLESFDATKGAKDEFNMGVWYEQYERGTPGCGTAACALGWATTIPAFRDAGLYRDECGDPTFGFACGLGAGANFFGLTAEQSSHLFWPYSYGKNDDKSPRGVAARIRELLGAKA